MSTSGTGAQRLEANSREDWSDNEQLISYLGRQLRDGRLTLVIGSGLSRAFGLPDWDELVRRLCAKHGHAWAHGLTCERIAEEIEERYYKDQPTLFLDAVKSALYATASVELAKLSEYKVFTAIASMVITARRKSCASVVSLNWDDLLESYLEWHGFDARAVSSDRFWNPSGDVAVFHPHGLLPHSPSRARSDGIVFTQASYNAIRSRNGGLRRAMLNVLATHTCLFLGTSGRDTDVDELMQEAKAAHASRDEDSIYWAVNYTTDTEHALAATLERRGVFVRRLHSYDDLPRDLFDICQAARNQR